jgi:benzoyl-CoA reductase/2-hydroxyglutaryl-CoA dehydratase subunit BcrC/BadD/HgdB
MKGTYSRAREAKERGEKIAWGMRGVPVEPLVAMGIVVCWPEPYTSLFSAKRLEAPMLDKARTDGFSRFSCGYCTAGLGYVNTIMETGGLPPNAPDGGMPLPDMLITTNLLCDSRQKFFEVMGRYVDIPYYGVDHVFPHLEGNFGDNILDWEEMKYGGDIKGYIKHRGWEHYVKYYREEVKRFIEFLEKQTGRKMDYDHLMECVQLELKIWKKWYEIQEMRKHVPCPLPAGDHLSIFYPGWWVPCQQETLEFFERTCEEVKFRMDNNISVVSEEKYRLLWAAGVPFWHHMNMLNFFEDNYGAVVVLDVPYHTGRPVEVNSSDPLECIAIEWMLRESYERFAYEFPERLIQWIKEYRIDGTLWHHTMSCRVATVGAMLNNILVHEKTGVPALFLESDLIDSRTFNETEWQRRIDDFMAVLETHKNAQM